MTQFPFSYWGLIHRCVSGRIFFCQKTKFIYLFIYFYFDRELHNTKLDLKIGEECNRNLHPLLWIRTSEQTVRSSPPSPPHPTQQNRDLKLPKLLPHHRLLPSQPFFSPLSTNINTRQPPSPISHHLGSEVK